MCMSNKCTFFPAASVFLSLCHKCLNVSAPLFTVAIYWTLLSEKGVTNLLLHGQGIIYQKFTKGAM